MPLKTLIDHGHDKLKVFSGENGVQIQIDNADDEAFIDLTQAEVKALVQYLTNWLSE